MKKTCLYVVRRGLQEQNRSLCSNEGSRSSTGLMDPRTAIYHELFISRGLTIYYWSQPPPVQRWNSLNIDDVLVDIFQNDETIKVNLTHMV